MFDNLVFLLSYSDAIYYQSSNYWFGVQYESAEKISDVSNLFDRKRVASSSQILEPYWVDDYICSACGIEVPASFTEERREHLDYHLADMLQKEECR